MSGNTALLAVHEAAYALAAGDATLMALAPIYDAVPQDEGLPWIRLEIAEVPDDTAGQQGMVETLLFTVASAYRGLRESYQVADRLIALFRHTVLTVTGWECERILYQGAKQLEPEVVDGQVIYGLAVEFSCRVWEA